MTIFTSHAQKPPHHVTRPSAPNQSLPQPPGKSSSLPRLTHIPPAHISPLMVALTPSKQGAKKNRNASSTWSLTEELAVQSLYVVQGLSPKQIGDATGKQAKRISNLIMRRGWTSDRRQRSKKAEDLQRSQAKQHVERVVLAQSALAEAASIGALSRAADCTQNKNKDAAKDFRSWAGGARDLVNVMRQARGLVDPGKGSLSGDAESEGRAISLSFFIGNITPQSGQSSAGPVIEIEASPISDPALAPSKASNGLKSKGMVVSGAIAGGDKDGDGTGKQGQ